MMTMMTSTSSTVSGTPILSVQNLQIPLRAKCDRTDRLWLKAAERLEGQVDFGNTNKRDVLAEVLSLAKEKQANTAKAQLKITRRNGDVIRFRDVYGRIASCVQKFKEVGDVVVQFDTGHASLPWFGIRLFLQIAVNDNDRYVAMLEGIDIAADIITRSAIIENLYLSPKSLTSAPGENLQSALLKLYVEILRFLGDATNYYNQNRIARIGKGIFQPVETTIQKQVLAILREECNVENATQHVKAFLDQDRNSAVDSQFEQLQGILARMQSPALDFRDQIVNLVEQMARTREAEVLAWLSSIPYAQHHENIRNGRLSDTGRWLMEKPAFGEWRTSKQSAMLWVHGIPGCGKSKLVSAVIDELRTETIDQQDTVRMAYFYCARDVADTKRAEPEEIIRSITRQLSRSTQDSGISEATETLFQLAHSKEGDCGRPSISDCIQLISRLTEKKTVFIIVDALDETNPSRRHELNKAFEKLLSSYGSILKIFISSRDDADIMKRLRLVSNIEVRPVDNSDDIKRFIRTELEQYINDGRLLDGYVSEELKVDITNILETGAQGMFLWVSLQLENLSDPQRMLMEADVRAELKHLPGSLVDLYSAACDQIERSGATTRYTATTTLKWLLCARRPLSIQELLGAVSVDHEGKFIALGVEDIIGMCRNLIVYDRDMDVLRFAHLSVRDYLESREGFAASENDSVAAERCLDVVSAIYNPNPVPSAKLKQNLEMEAYAAILWLFHYRNIAPELRSERLERKTLRFFFGGDQRNNAFTRWMSSVLELVESIDNTSYVAKCLVSVNSDPRTPLFAACIFGLPQVLSRLREISQFDSSTCNSLGKSALSLANEHGNFGIVQALLQPTASQELLSLPVTDLPVSIWPSDQAESYVVALQEAIVSGHPEAINMMLKSGKQKLGNVRLIDYATEVSAWLGNREAVSMLLGVGAMVRDPAQGSEFHLISQAALSGMDDLVKHLLHNGADVAQLSWDGNGISLLEYAAMNGHSKVIDVVFDYGGSVLTSNMVQKITAFHDAASYNHAGCIRALFDGTVKQFGRPAALDILNMRSTRRRETALHYATRLGHIDCVDVLLDLGAECSFDRDHTSPFWQAVKAGRMDMIDLFLSKPCGMFLAKRREFCVGTALHWAAQEGKIEVCRALLTLDPRLLCETNDKIDTPLHLAVRNARVNVVALFYEAANSSSKISAQNLFTQKNRSSKTPTMEQKGRWLSDLLSSLREKNTSASEPVT